MDTIVNSVPFLAENWALITVIFGAVIAVATVIVRKTPNLTDDKVLDAILEVRDALSKDKADKEEK